MNIEDQDDVDQPPLDAHQQCMPSTSPVTYSKRRTRRALPRSSSHQPMIGMINATILAIGLTVILASRCDDQSTTSSSQSGWLDSLITPSDLQLPKSVTDRLQETEENSQLPSEPKIKGAHHHRQKK